MSELDLLRDIAGDEADLVMKALQSPGIEFDQRQWLLVRYMCVQAWMCGFEFSSGMEEACRERRA